MREPGFEFIRIVRVSFSGIFFLSRSRVKRSPAFLRALDQGAAVPDSINNHDFPIFPQNSVPVLHGYFRIRERPEKMTAKHNVKRRCIKRRVFCISLPKDYVSSTGFSLCFCDFQHLSGNINSCNLMPHLSKQ